MRFEQAYAALRFDPALPWAAYAVLAGLCVLALLPAVRAIPDSHLIIADGTSCRHQIRDLSGREALHSIRVLEMALA